MEEQNKHLLTAMPSQGKAKLLTKLPILQTIMVALIAGTGAAASAAPMIHAVTNAGEQVNGGQSFGMSRSGRYIASPVKYPGDPTKKVLAIFDLQSQTLGVYPTPFLTYVGYEFISPGGRYVSYPTPINPSASKGIVFDRVAQISIDIPSSDESRALSDNGFVATRNQHPVAGATWEDPASVTSWNGLIRFNIFNKAQRQIPNFTGQNSRVDRLDWFSADGQVILFNSSDTVNNTSSFQIFNASIPGNNKVVPFNPIENNIPLHINADLGDTTIALSSNGKYVAFKTDNANNSTNKFLYRASLAQFGHFLRSYDLSTLYATVENGISISNNGRYISFRGQLKPNHPEYSAAQALGHTSFYRIFRYDSELHQLVTVSVAKDGGPIRNRYLTSGVASVYPSTIISDDGSIIGFSSDADNLTSSIVNNSTAKKYYAYVSNGFSRNYQFVDLPNSDNGNSAFAPMTLVGNNQWEAVINFDGVNTESFKINAGGNLATATPTATPLATFGSSSTAGQAVASGGNIVVTGGYGSYRVTFNDQTLKYTVTKEDWKRTVILMYGQTQSGQDMFIRGGLDHAKAKTVLGRDCDLNNSLCSIPIRHSNVLNPTTLAWKQNDSRLDWQAAEVGQGANAQGTPLDWTTDYWPTSWGATKTVALNGYGETPLNLWGQHYWLLDVEMDCSKTANGWFELKSFISNGPGWEGNIVQSGTPWASNNHFAVCGKMNVFKRGQNAPVVVGGTI